MRRFQMILVLAMLLALLPILGSAQKGVRPFNGHKDKAYISKYTRAKARVNKRFSAEQRASIAQELVQAENRGADAARKRAPVSARRGTPTANKQQTRQTRLAGRLTAQYQRQVRAKYHLTPEEMVIINREAVTKNIKVNQ